MISEVPHSKAVVILVHGMQEYSDRYADFCKYLNDHGYTSIRYDLLGHGKKLDAQQRGYFGKHGWRNLLEQLHQYVQQAHAQFPGQHIILFGHSMGSILIRSYLQRYQDFDGMILSGVPYYNPLWRVGKLLSNTIIHFRGGHRTSRLLAKLTTGGFNKKVSHPLTKFDWLSHDRSNVQSYIHDAACGFPFTNQGYSDLYDGMGELGRLRHFTSKHPVPVLFLKGADDPCAGNRSEVKSSIDMLKNAGYRDLTLKIYQKMRHEILFEKNAHVVKKDIVNWLDQRFS
ncbi:alpha/beta fold hydrolase [Limosilactobacillus secaliphilus]|uniref:Lysophospholipase n=1 Tax=Limosilactobacillus secaliphilus TaxID=396268 RepID=A0A0R2I843_9LACO|nr:alpha/beta fold hydrolase [Limosilactobacillus secaliphilus]KRN58199.1 lysophospholipase [Limosilactobacillus secaliphilus]